MKSSRFIQGRRSVQGSRTARALKIDVFATTHRYVGDFDCRSRTVSGNWIVLEIEVSGMSGADRRSEKACQARVPPRVPRRRKVAATSLCRMTCRRS